MDKAWQAAGPAARPLVHSASAPQQPQRAGSEQADLLHACSAQARLEGAPSATPSDGGSEKVQPWCPRCFRTRLERNKVQLDDADVRGC